MSEGEGEIATGSGAANCKGVRISGRLEKAGVVAQGISVRQACLIFELRKTSCADCIILEVARECLTRISERRARAERGGGQEF